MKPLTFSTQQHDRTTKARRKYLKLQDAPDKTAPLPVTAPNVQGIIDSDDGTLHKDRLKTDLTVEIPAWSDLPPGSDPNDYSTLQLQFTLTGAENTFRAIGPVEKFLPPLVPGDFPLALAFPQASIPRNGKLWIRYELVDHKGDQYVSHPIELICDSVPPWGDEPAPPLTAPTDIINEAYLTNHQAGIELGIPEYPDRTSKDTYQAFYLKEWPEENADYDNPVVNGTVTDDRKITIPADVVRSLGDGRFYIVYYLFDKAQNRSRIRLPATVDVVLTPEPKDLLPPEVPLAADDGVLSLKDAQAGVHIEIRAYTNSRKEDKIAIKWGTTPLIVEQVGSRPFPVSIPVPSDILRNEYGKASGEVATPVSYQVLRGHAAYGPAADDFAVDFSVAGPERPDPDPDWPDPVNDKMIELLSESLEGLSAAMIAELGRYRHQVFIEKLGWDVVSTSRVRDQEFDQFDHPQTRYIVAMGRQGICGCARLLPTTDAYLLKDVFAYLCSETPPSDPSVWELSRYAASAADDPQLAMKIFWSSLQCGWYLGASSVVAVTTTAMERYFVRNGVILQRLGPPQKVKGETLVAISFPAYQERGLEMLLRYHPEWLQGVPLSMAV